MRDAVLCGDDLSRAPLPWLRFARFPLWAGVLVALSGWTSAHGAENGQNTTPSTGTDGTAVSRIEGTYDGNVHLTLTPYLWLPAIDGAVRFRAPPGATGRPTFDFSISPMDLLSHLDIGFMGAGEVRQGNWSVFTDLMYLKLSGADAAVRSITGPGGIVEIPVNEGTTFGLHGFIWTVAPSYTVYRSSAASLDVFAGFRDVQLTPTLKWKFTGPLNNFSQSGSFSEAIVVWDALVGTKGRIALSEDGKWFAPYYADIGIGSKAFTWQALIGVGYTFAWGDLHLDYRALYYSPEKDIPLKHLVMQGPAFAANFSF